jgi:hypothetical protein
VEFSDGDRERAMHAHELLDSWCTLPGSGIAGSIDRQELEAWIALARKSAAEVNRAKVTDSLIGKLLSHSPVGADGAWPAEPVRDIIERLGSKALENGIAVGKFNSRGVVTRNPSDGGIQERQLANMYKRYAAKVQAQWPRTAAVLRGMADGYLRDARREDDQAELLELLDA